jgi:peptide/nickel transport system substrate-binding protein
VQSLGENHPFEPDCTLVASSRTFKPEPQLATAWKEISPTQVRFTLRSGVKFSDGTPFTADDVVSSIHRAMARTSRFSIYTEGIDKVVKVSDSTVDLVMKAPNPVLLNQLTELRIMSKAWADRNKAQEPKDMRTKDETFSHRNAMGTGQYSVKEWRPDQRLVLVKNPNYWGKSESNVTEIIYTPIKSEATRIAALLSGEVDFVLDPSPQDQDVRVRKALYQAIDSDSLHKVTMRGLSQPTGTLVAPQVNGWTEAVHKRIPFDVEGAKKLLADAGYPQGFEVDFACPNNRYINDEEICQAVTAMWSRIGVRANLRTLPLVTYFPMLQRYEASIYMLGWGVPTFDSLFSLQSLVRTVGTGGDGNYNVGRYSNSRMDVIVDRVKVETDLPVRNRFLTEGLQLSNDTVSHIPLHNQIIPWAMKKNVEVVHRPDNRLDWRLIKVNGL